MPTRDLIAASSVRASVADLITRDHPGWCASAYICRTDLGRYRADFVQNLLKSERGELTSLDQEVIRSLRDHDLLATNVDAEFEGTRTLGETLADRLAVFGGSWTFLISFGVFLLAWIGVNTFVLYRRPPDPYPYILLNLILSCLASIQAPVILMSQSRQEAKDRRRSQHDYQVNLKAELEIRHLHEKVDHLLTHQWERLVEIQQMQLDLLDQLGKK